MTKGSARHRIDPAPRSDARKLLDKGVARADALIARAIARPVDRKLLSGRDDTNAAYLAQVQSLRRHPIQPVGLIAPCAFGCQREEHRHEPKHWQAPRV